MTERLAVRALVVRRMPGFPDGGPRLEDLSPGINLVHGPNASGKTTTALALQGLLWPRTSPPDAGLEGRFDLGDAGWSVRVEARRAGWQREGQESPAPPLPPADDRDRYYLSLHGLLVEDDRGLAERVRIESAGGYDLRAAAAALAFGAGGRPKTLLDERAAAHAALADARSREAGLREERVELERLRERRADLERQAAGLEAARRSLAVARAEETEASRRRAVAGFPAGLARLRGDELDRLAEWDAAEREADATITSAAAAEREAEAWIEAVGLGEAGLPASILTELEDKLDALRRLDDETARVGGEHAEARARRERAAAALGVVHGFGPDGTGDLFSAPGVVDLTVAAAERLDSFIRRATRLRQRRAELVARIGAEPAAEPGAEPGADARADVESLAEAARLLRRWLRLGAGQGAGAAAGRLRTLLLVAAIALAVAGLAALVAGPAWVKAAGGALIALAASLLWARPAPPGEVGRGDLEARVRRLGREPERWSVDAVEAALDALERESAEARHRAERQRDGERVAAQLRALEAEEAALEADRKALAGAVGVLPPSSDLALDLVAGRVRELEGAREAETATAARLADLESRRAGLLADCERRVRPCGYDAADTAAVAGALRDLRMRRERHQAAVNALETARRDLARGSTALEETRRRRAELFERVGVSADQADTVRRWADQLDEFRAAQQELDVAERELRNAELALAELAPDAPPAGAATVPAPDAPPAGAAAVPALEEALARAQAAAEEERGVAEGIARIETRIADARSKHDVEEALARVAAADAALADRRRADVEAEVGGALVDWLAARASDLNRPAVFHRARDLFGRISRGRYRLDVQEGDAAAFRAYDTTTHRGQALGELSSGTRLQLLLAVRLAFVETQETGAALPLLLDEVLANSDDERANAILDAALAIARGGRQLFYFTAQADELGKWMARLRAQDDVDWCVRPIRPDGGVPVPDLEWPEPARADLPAPDGIDHAAYGRALAVPPFDPWADGVGGLHLWYLVDDLDALHRLLADGIARWGQLEHLATAGGDQALTDGLADVIELARRRAILADRFRLLWRRGRGRPVDRTVLVESGAVSGIFLDQVVALCQEVDGRGQDLVQALADRRVPRFQLAKTEELAGFLQDQGYLPADEPLPPDAIRALLAGDADDGTIDEVDGLIRRLTRTG